MACYQTFVPNSWRAEVDKYQSLHARCCRNCAETKHLLNLSVQGYQNAASHPAAADWMDLIDLEAYYTRLLPQLNTIEPEGTTVSKLLTGACSMQEAQSEKGCTNLLYAPYVDDMLLEQAQTTVQKATLCQPVASSVLGDPRASELWLMLMFSFNV